jgi:hypothetical protein
MLKQPLRQFVDRELIPIEMHSQENNELKPDIRDRLEKKAKDIGAVDGTVSYTLLNSGITSAPAFSPSK